MKKQSYQRYRIYKATLTAVVCLAITGCAKPKLTVFSQPEGAYISDLSGNAFGVAPVTLNYNLDDLKKHRDSNGCFLVGGIQGTWPSGASSSSGTIKLCVVSTLSFNVTINRRPESPGLDKDLQFALQLQQARQQSIQQKDNADNQALMMYMLMKK